MGEVKKRGRGRPKKSESSPAKSPIKGKTASISFPVKGKTASISFPVKGKTASIHSPAKGKTAPPVTQETASKNQKRKERADSVSDEENESTTPKKKKKKESALPDQIQAILSKYGIKRKPGRPRDDWKDIERRLKENGIQETVQDILNSLYPSSLGTGQTEASAEANEVSPCAEPQLEPPAPPQSDPAVPVN